MKRISPLLAAGGLCLALVVVGSLPLIVAASVATSGSAAVTKALERVKTEMIAHNAIIMTVLFAILAANEAAQVIRHLI